MNREAKHRFGCVPCSFGSLALCASGSRLLEELVAYIGHAQRGSICANGVSFAPSLECLRPGESVVLRTIELDRSRRCVLACLCASPSAASVDELEAELGLSSREKEIARRAAEGYSVLCIATQLGIAESTVCTHLKRIYRKLGVCSRAELAWRIVREPRIQSANAT